MLRELCCTPLGFLNERSLERLTFLAHLINCSVSGSIHWLELERMYFLSFVQHAHTIRPASHDRLCGYRRGIPSSSVRTCSGRRETRLRRMTTSRVVNIRTKRKIDVVCLFSDRCIQTAMAYHHGVQGGTCPSAGKMSMY